MSATWSTYGRTQLLAAVLTPDTYVPPPSWWIALCLNSPHANDDGSTLIEPATSTGYTRITAPLGSSEWVSAGVGEFANVNPFTLGFPLSHDAGRCVGWALVDSGEYGEGNVWVVGSLVEPFAMYAGQTLHFDNAILGLYD